MLHPSYSELIDVLNTNTDDDNQVTSRYTVVIAAAKRARQLTEGAKRATDTVNNDKYVSVAIAEMTEGKLKVQLGPQAKQENRDHDPKNGLALTTNDKITKSLNFDIDDDELDEFNERLLDSIEDDSSSLITDLELEEDILEDDLPDGVEKISLDEELELQLETELFNEDPDVFDDDDGYGD